MKLILFTTAGVLTAGGLIAHNAEPLDRPDSHAPISIMADHTHDAGEWMLSYRYMRMEMDGMRSGTNGVSSAGVFAEGFTITPENMTMDMNMFGVMYAPTDSLTLVGMVNYTFKSMDHRINPGAPQMLFNVVGGDTFRTETDGFGDTKVGALYQFYNEDEKKAHIGLSLSLPTGSIDEKDQTPRPGMPPTFNTNLLPASMQLGSGTFDLLPSITWLRAFETWSYGVQANGTVRLESENDNGYRLGDQFELVAWSGYVVADWVSLEGGLSYEWTGELEGTQEGIGRVGPAGRSVTTAFNENYGGEVLDAILGVNFIVPSGVLRGHRFAADIRLPLWQDLNGLQLETDWVLTLGWQKSW
ncbi:MAG: transporter [Verrucomicrobiota bacterium]